MRPGVTGMRRGESSIPAAAKSGSYSKEATLSSSASETAPISVPQSWTAATVIFRHPSATHREAISGRSAPLP
jgi:hypothetical protein